MLTSLARTLSGVVPSELVTTTLETSKISLKLAKTRVLGPLELPTRLIAGVPVASAQELAFEKVKGEYVQNATSADVRFGRLTENQFADLRAEFQCTETLKYSSQKEYALRDFLPPMLQVLLHRDLDAKRAVKIEGSKKFALTKFGNRDGKDLIIRSTVNCHGTAWEVMRAYQGKNLREAELLFGDGLQMEGLLNDSKSFQAVRFSGQAKELKNLRPGEAVAFFDESKNLLHTSVYVGGGLFFEKPNTESDSDDETPYRLATFDQVQKPLKELGFSELTVKAFRSVQTLPKGPDAFKSEEGETLEAWLKERGQALDAPVTTYQAFGLLGATQGVEFLAVQKARWSLDAQGRLQLK